LQKAYSHMHMAEGSLPLTEKIHREVLSLPIGPHLTPFEQQRVISEVCGILAAETACEQP